MTSMTPGEAGKRAAELLTEQQQQQQTTTAAETLLSHAGVADPRMSSSSSTTTTSSHPNISLAPPLEFATTYTRPAAGDYHPDDAKYTRIDNPTRVLLEQTVSQLECHGIIDIDNNNNNTVNVEIDHGQTTCAFASGMMAASSIALAHAMPMTVLLPDDLYHGVSTVMADVFQARFGVTVKHISLHRLNDNNNNEHDNNVLAQELQAAVARHQKQQQNSNTNKGSILVWMETPSNPCIHVIDMKRVCDIVNHVRDNNPDLNITTIVDSTMAPPVIQQPLQFGVDLVMHSGTKYFGGHSDVLLGLVTASPVTPRGRELAPIVRQVQYMVGGVASPMDSWLALRGMRTLHLRVQRQCETAFVLAKHLYTETHKNNNTTTNNTNTPIVTAVHYPGLESHPQHAVAQRQMTCDNYGGVLSVELKSEHMAMAFAGALQTIYRATSLGGTETLIEHRASIEPPERRTSPPGLLRISVGLEDPTDLIADIDNALAIAQRVEEEIMA